ncbi:RNA-dependent DNA polymerase [Phytophthora cinnamomi]|uniref:RNA-dependent DNA polymerase n=1 Tax=Phytophthora cinnamomi TaxID=4785 RepID=UPI00355AAF27|nr:RNA-dependent DNA polymerase [Phytophthora cinnamomi]
MPSAAIQADAFQGKKIFARFDFTQGFWQLPLHEDSREIFSFVTPDGVYTPTRVPQGAMDSALHFQSQVQAKLAPLIPHSALVWVDDVILFAPTIAEFLQTLRTFSRFEGIRHDPSRVSALTELPLPATVADLQYFVCATNWLHDSLPDYARTIAPLQDKLNDERTRIGRRSRNALNVPTTWSPAEEVAFKTVVSLVKDSAPMAFPDPDVQLLLFTDASATGYSIILTQTRSRHIVPVEELSPLRPLADEQFIFPKRADLHAAQLAASRERSRLQHASEEEDGVVTVDNRPWVPTNAKDLLARIFVVAHCGSQGHRGQDAMALVLKERFYTVNLDDKVAKFVRQCLLCKHFKGPRQIPRPYGPLLTPTQRNEVVHWDFLSLGDGFGDSKYLLVVKDGISHFCELFPCATPTAYVAAESLTLWYARYGLPQTLKSDQGTHFRNEMVKHLAARLKMELHFTPVYSPWLNGTIERLNKDVLQVLRALLMEYGLDQHEWPYLLPAIQANLNHTPVPSLAGHAPVEVFTGLPASSALDVIVVPAGSEHAERVVDLDDIGGFVGQLRSSLHAIHQDVSDAKERQRLRDMASHKGIPVNFDVVVAALAHSFEIEHLVTGRKYDVHASRLKFYADAELDTTAELLELVSSQGMLLGVEKLVDHRYNHDLNRWELFVSWAGLQAIENSWEPLITLLHDVPAKVREYIDAAEDDELSAQID